MSDLIALVRTDLLFLYHRTIVDILKILSNRN